MLDYRKASEARDTNKTACTLKGGRLFLVIVEQMVKAFVD